MQRPAGRTILTSLAWSAGLVPWSTADGMIRLHPQPAVHVNDTHSDHPGAGVPPPKACRWTHGSGGRLCDLANLCYLPAWTRSLILAMAVIIPRIFRDMKTGPVTARTVQGMARVRSGQAPAWSLVSDRSARRGSRVKHDLACTFTRKFPSVLVGLRSQSCLRLEGRAHTLSGPSPDPSRARTLAPFTRLTSDPSQGK